MFAMEVKTPHFYHIDKLRERIANRKQTIECGKPPYEDVPVRGLIDEVSHPLPSIQDLPREKWADALGAKGDTKIIELQKKSWPTQTETDRKIPKVFISYAHEDEKFKEEIDEMMAGMKRRGVIETWQDRLIEPGDDWSESIQTAMNDADIALLLISRYFINSRFINDEEVPKLLRTSRVRGNASHPYHCAPLSVDK